VDDAERHEIDIGQADDVRPDPVLPPVFTLDEAVRAGLSPQQVRRRVATGRWRRLRPGVYCTSSAWAPADARLRHEWRAAAVAAGMRGARPHAFSHATAAALLGLPVSRGLLDRVHVTVPPGFAMTRARNDMVWYAAALPPGSITSVRGVAVTSPARTVADCLRHLDAVDSVALADAAVRARSVTADDVRRVLAFQRRWPFTQVAALALVLVDGRHESSLESRSAVVMHRAGLPPPEPQVSIHDEVGRFVGRVDFAWLEQGVVGEADGRIKYADGDAVRVIEAEKERQARLEALGLVVVRWGWRDLEGAAPRMVERVRQALERGDAKRFRGRAA
jgi:predicted transcriptional regulator of viral defense system/very-short-patch-repair endonuclease